METLIRSLSKFSEQALLVISGQSDVSADAGKIGPVLIFERLWRQTSIKYAIERLLAGRKFEFDVDRAMFLTVLHRLMVSGSDRFCSRWCRDYTIDGIEGLDFHHLYRAMGFLGEQVSDQIGASRFWPTCGKDLVEELVFSYRHELFSNLNLIFFGTISIYFQEHEVESIGKRGFRPDLVQTVVEAVIDEKGQPICCEMWNGNRGDFTTLLLIVEQFKKYFKINRVCIPADRGMISLRLF